MHTDLTPKKNPKFNTSHVRWLMPIIPPIAYYLSTWEAEEEELVLNLSMIPPHAKHPPKNKKTYK